MEATEYAAHYRPEGDRANKLSKGKKVPESILSCVQTHEIGKKDSGSSGNDKIHKPRPLRFILTSSNNL